MASSIWLSANELSYSIANNTSVVRVTINITVTGDTWNGYGMGFTVNANGVSKYTTKAVYKNSTVSYSYDFTVPHEADGTKSVYCWGQIDTGVSVGSVSRSATITLTTIPRASNLTVENGTLGTAQTLTVTKQASAFTHTITWSCGTYSGTICTKSSDTSISFTPAIEWATGAPNGASVYCDFSLVTFNGDTQVGVVYKSAWFAIPSSVIPTCSVSVTDAMGYASTYGGYVKSKSKFAVAVTGAGIYYSTIKSYSVSANGLLYSSSNITTDVVSTVGSNTITATVMDSRSRVSAEANVSATVLDYSSPSLTFDVRRCDSDGTPNDGGVYCQVTYSAAITALGNLNTKTLLLEYKKAKETTYTSDSIVMSSYTVNSTAIFEADDGFTYDVRMTVTDAFESVSKTVPLSTAATILHINESGKGLAIGKVSEEDAFEVGMSSQFYQSVTTNSGLFTSFLAGDRSLLSEYINERKLIVLPEVTYQYFQTGTHLDFFRELLVWVCQTYPDVEKALFTGIVTPSSSGSLLLNVYDTSLVDANGLPRYASGRFFELGGGSYEFKTIDYVYSYQNSVLNAYPIGSLYYSYSRINPENFFGGTWVNIPANELYSIWRRTA